MTIQIDGRYLTDTDENILRTVLIPGKLLNIITKEPKIVSQTILDQIEAEKQPVNPDESCTISYTEKEG